MNTLPILYIVWSQFVVEWLFELPVLELNQGSEWPITTNEPMRTRGKNK